MIKRILKGLAYGVGGLAVAVAALVMGALAASEVMIRRPWPKADVAIRAAADAGAVARGREVALLNGCADCHGDGLTGRLFFDEKHVARIWAPNLTLAVASQSDADLVRAMRYGVRPDGQALWAMPSAAQARLTDAELAGLLAYLRSLPPSGQAQPEKQVGPIARIGMLTGRFRSAAAEVEALRSVAPPDLGPQFAEGRRLSRLCMECHGVDLKGTLIAKAPDLLVAGAYDLADFERLLRTGVAAGNRDNLYLMSEVSRARYQGLTSAQIAALHAYLKARAEAAS